MTAHEFVQMYLKFYYDSVVMRNQDMHEKFDDLAEMALQIINEKN